MYLAQKEKNYQPYLFNVKLMITWLLHVLNFKCDVSFKFGFWDPKINYFGHYFGFLYSSVKNREYEGEKVRKKTFLQMLAFSEH